MLGGYPLGSVPRGGAYIQPPVGEIGNIIEDAQALDTTNGLSGDFEIFDELAVSAETIVSQALAYSGLSDGALGGDLNIVKAAAFPVFDEAAQSTDLILGLLANIASVTTPATAADALNILASASAIIVESANAGDLVTVLTAAQQAGFVFEGSVADDTLAELADAYGNIAEQANADEQTSSLAGTLAWVIQNTANADDRATGISSMEGESSLRGTVTTKNVLRGATTLQSVLRGLANTKPKG